MRKPNKLEIIILSTLGGCGLVAGAIILSQPEQLTPELQAMQAAIKGYDKVCDKLVASKLVAVDKDSRTANVVCDNGLKYTVTIWNGGDRLVQTVY